MEKLENETFQKVCMIIVIHIDEGGSCNRGKCADIFQ